MNKISLFTFSLFAILSTSIFAQRDTTYANKDAVYSRPFVIDAGSNKFRTAVGGYMEGGLNYFQTDGITEGMSMELRRFNMFMYSKISNGIRFMSELEFEHGTEEIALETAFLDFKFHPYFQLRAGIILPPLGYFNQNHDSPRWDFVERPLVSTNLIPSTYSDVGFSLHGSIPFNKRTLTYEVAMSNGLQDGITANEEQRTFVPVGKNEDIFGEDNNGRPAFSGRIATKESFGEIGVSAYRGAYNSYMLEGEEIDDKRNLSILALDYQLSFSAFSSFTLDIIGEWAIISADVAPNSEAIYSNKQFGFHTDFILRSKKMQMGIFENVSLSTGIRTDIIDYNLSKFKSTGKNLGDKVFGITPMLSMRFDEKTVIRFNYRWMSETDVLNNPPALTGGFQLGFASYF